jgi:hypothetical protein
LNIDNRIKYSGTLSYLEIIKEPMDLSTMTAKLEGGMYPDRDAFKRDFDLMISNAKLYNATGSFPHNEACTLQTAFEKCEYLGALASFTHLANSMGENS